jgi:hydrogenase expression/formation protein HypC
MCLAIPMRLVEVTSAESGIAELEGARYQVGLALIENPRQGSYVIVHAGFAIETLDEAEAAERIRLFEEIARMVPPAPPAAPGVPGP